MKTAFQLIVGVSLLATCMSFKDDDFVNEPALGAEKQTDEESLQRRAAAETPPAKLFDYVAKYVGCYNDKPGARAMPILYANFRDSIDWSDMKKTIKACADEAKARGIKYFGIQFYGECWYGKTGMQDVVQYGTSNNCWKKVGKHWTNAVYKFGFVLKTGNEIS